MTTRYSHLLLGHTPSIYIQWHIQGFGHTLLFRILCLVCQLNYTRIRESAEKAH